MFQPQCYVLCILVILRICRQFANGMGRLENDAMPLRAIDDASVNVEVVVSRCQHGVEAADTEQMLECRESQGEQHDGLLPGKTFLVIFKGISRHMSRVGCTLCMPLTGFGLVWFPT